MKAGNKGRNRPLMSPKSAIIDEDGNKVSGVPNVRWEKTRGGVWRVCFRNQDTSRYTTRCFPLKRYMEDKNFTEDKADKYALQDALTFRLRLANEGILPPTFISEIEGVTWAKRDRTWRARYHFKSKRKVLEKHFHVTNPTPQEMERVMRQCERQRREWDKTYGRPLKGMAQHKNPAKS